MKDADIETLGQVASLLRAYIPLKEYEVYEKHLNLCDRLKAKNDKQKQRYQDKAEYHREVTRKWRQDNKERNAAYQKKYNADKRAEKQKSD